MRFRLSLGIQFSLEVFSTLSKVPIFVRAHQEQGVQKQGTHSSDKDDDDDDDDDDNGARWADGLADNDNSETDNRNDEPLPKSKQASKKNEPKRKEILKAVQSYAKRPVELRNVAHSLQPIRVADATIEGSPPQLEVHMIVCGPDDEEETSSDRGASGPAATLRLVRMVNRIPLLDSAEASACGLVQGLPNKAIWGSFGLHVARSSELDIQSWVPTFDVRDNDSVAPFFKNQTHAQWEARDEDEDDSDIEARFRKRKGRPARSRLLLPANVRLGEILVIVHIHAEPSSLPLPSLSKVRFVD
jgi:hypothetical protein